MSSSSIERPKRSIGKILRKVIPKGFKRKKASNATQAELLQSDSESQFSDGQTRPTARQQPFPANPAQASDVTSSPAQPDSIHKGELSAEQQSLQPIHSQPPQVNMPLEYNMPKTTPQGNILPGVKKTMSAAWTGFKLVAEKAEGFLDGTPFKIPVAAINTLIGISDAVITNRESMKDLLLSIDIRLQSVMQEFLKLESPNEIKSSFGRFAEKLVDVANQLGEMKEKGILQQIVESNEDPGKIKQIYGQVDEATTNFQLEMTLANIRLTQKIEDNTEHIRLRDLRPAPEATYAHGNRSLCTEDTRVDILNAVIAWCKDKSVDSSTIFWLSGRAGTGKSTIAHTLCNKLLQEGRNVTRLGASFFCSRQIPNARKHENIIPTIASQLAHSFPLYRKKLLELELDVSPPPLKDHIKEMLINPWNQSIGGQDNLPPLLVIVDALDEIENGEGSQFLKELISTIAAQEAHQGLKFFVTSRQDTHIEEVCRSLSSQAIIRLQDVATDVIDNDIHLYLTKSLPALDRDQLRYLAAQAAGLFIYAVTAFRFISRKSSKTPQQKLEIILKSWPKRSEYGPERPPIDNLYEGILKEFFLSQSEDDQSTAAAILQTILCAQEPLLLSDIPRLLWQPPQDSDYPHNLIESLHAVLYIENMRIYSYHKSFVDFMSDLQRIEDSMLKSIFISYPTTTCHYNLTVKCLELMKSLKFNICGLPSSFQNDDKIEDLSACIDKSIPSVVQYSCRFWAAHLKGSYDSLKKQERAGIKDTLIQWLNEKSLFWIEVMSLLKIAGECYHSLRSVRMCVRKDINLEDIKDLIAVENLITTFVGGISTKSTPHLYVSALALSPYSMGVIKTWQNRFPGIPKVNMKIRQTPQLLVREHTAEVNSVTFSPDGTQIAFGSGDFSIQIWDASTGEEVLKLVGHTGPVLSVAFSPDGSRIASGSADKSLRIWNALTGQEVCKLHGHTDNVRSVAFSPNGTLITSGLDDASVQIWNASTGQEVHKLDGHTDYVMSVAFSPDGTLIASSSGDTSVQIWNALTGEKVHRLDGHTSDVNSVAFSPDGKWISSGSDDYSVRIWDAATGKEVHQLNGHSNWVQGIAFSPDSTFIASASDDKSVRIWNALSGEEIHKLDGHTSYVMSVAFSPDGTRIVSGSYDKSVRIWNVPIWDASTGKDTLKVDGHSDIVCSVAFSPDGTQIVSGSKDGTVQVWDALTRTQVHRLDCNAGRVLSVAFSPRGTLIASGSDYGVQIWEAFTGKLVHKLDGHTSGAFSVSFSTDGTRLSSGSGDNSVQIWNVLTGDKIQTLNGHTAAVISAAFSPDGTQIASCSGDNSVRIWDASTGDVVHIFNGHTEIVQSVALSPTDTWVASGSDDGSLRIWDTLTGNEVRRIDANAEWILSVAFSPDGKQIAFGSSDQCVWICNALTGEMVHKLNGHTDWVQSVAFSSDGTWIASGSSDNSVRIWNASPTNVINSADDPQLVESTINQLPFQEFWYARYDGWILSQTGQRLMWISPTLIQYVNQPECQVISSGGCIDIDFQASHLGEDWNCIYIGDGQ
ncbi:hypothetical protein GYMLUDRAFT_942491 [Collybiopsis luxurians FD-317 M1]|uniref:WD40 repeat-like protein n=1 Tax=Collybiopsis luxurians FD-317 M1 TaxID=944289 RepID=A0A0D0C5P3_9AGAR|nr:hypothetical protein GYMLUDRAFT_942491 [Collybiopsis luxurians FD-317 M1]